MRYEAQREGRIKSSRFRDACPSYDQNQKKRYWWLSYEDGTGKWLSEEEIWDVETGERIYKGDKPVRWISTAGPKVRSVRAFRRRLKEWSKYLPKGTEFILMSKFIGFDVKAKTR